MRDLCYFIWWLLIGQRRELEEREREEIIDAKNAGYLPPDYPEH